MANKPKIKKTLKKKTHAWWKNNNKKQNKNSEKKEEARYVGEQQDKGWIHVIGVHDTTHLADNTAGQKTLTSYSTQRQNERSR